ncbi:MAG TPA: NAD(P)/FAD-dependent oxidoreductase [Spirochaetota bacterium]|jgi:thioredoxin reductase (NADPH)|nr:NAD(P)/FAD-dependent oxidoreductase [Spirochaetota bacterium]HOK93462.1 NAD(P)/FAD-dependent oxidoreductase [Spirochaetota bacterium]HPP96024.1 NAD(P)/FAD-dependent oxidoreductase [Spirochaetota bacterium]
MREYEVIIIGQGPAGLSAAIYTARANIKTLILGCDPKIAGDYAIDNYFGFHETISGKELIERGVAQASKFGAEILCDRVLSIHFDDSGKYIVKTERDEYKTCSVILATGVSRKKPDIPDYEKFDGKGISWCVSCDGFFFKDKSVLVAGEGNYAANQAIELTDYTSNVAICTLGKESTISADYRKRLKDLNIPVIEKSISKLIGDDVLKGVRFSDGEELKVDGIFIALGDASSTDFAKSLGIITEGNFIVVDKDMKTNAPGIFAAGDCTGGFLQIAVAVGSGAIAARSAISYVKESCRK